MRAGLGLAWILVGVLGCGRVSFEHRDAAPGPDSARDASPTDAATPDAPVDGASPGDGAPGGDGGITSPIVALTAADDVPSLCPAIAFSGGSLFVSWKDVATGGVSLHLRRFDANGAPETADATVVTAPAGTSFGCPDMTTDAGEVALTWTDARSGNPEVYFRLFSSDTVALGPDVMLTSGGSDTASPAIAAGGGGYAISFVETRGVNDHVNFLLLTSDGAVRVDVGQISEEGLFIDESDVTAIPGGFAVAYYRDDTFGANATYLTTISDAGAVLVPPVTIGEGNGAFAEGIAAVWDGSALGAAWVRDSDGTIAFRRLNESLGPLSEPLLVPMPATRAQGPTLAFSGTGYAVAYTQNRTGQDRVYLGEIDAAGSAVTRSSMISESGFASSSAVAWDGDAWLVAWSTTSGSTSGGEELEFRRVVP
jgi:hypothetical protein